MPLSLVVAARRAGVSSEVVVLNLYPDGIAWSRSHQRLGNRNWAPGQADLLASHLEVTFNQAGVPSTSTGSLLVVPEPGSIVLVLMGLVGLAAFGWR